MGKWIVFAMLALLPGTVQAQYTPSKGQYAKLAKQKAKLMKLQIEIARLQAESAFELGNLGRDCMEVVIANRWPLDVNCNPQSLTFGVPPAQPDPPLSTLAKPNTVVLQPAPEPKKP